MKKWRAFSLLANELLVILLIACTCVLVSANVYAFDDEPVEISVKQESFSRYNADETFSTNALRSSFNLIQNTAFEKENKAVYARITTYGVNCTGCYHNNGFGGTSSGVKVSWNPSVRQKDGTWKTGITYEGYYIVAANSSIPLGSIIEISNLGFNGYGLGEGQTFYAMVLDRGAMTLNHLDLFVGGEAGKGITINRAYVPTMKVIRYGY